MFKDILFRVSSCLALALLCSCGEPNKVAGTLKYDIILANGASTKLAINLSFPGQGQMTWVKIPAIWAGQKGFDQCISDIKVEPPAQLVATNQLNYLAVQHPVNSTVRLSYTFDAQQKISNPSDFFPLRVDSRGLHLIGETFLLMPEVFSKVITNCEFNWKLPSDWRFVSSFGSGTTLHTGVVESIDLNKALFVGGDLRLQQIQVAGRPVTIAMSDNWHFSDEDFGAVVMNIIGEARNMFNDHDFPSFLVSLARLETPTLSIQGIALTKSFAMLMPEKSHIIDDVAPLLAHEYIHTWNGGKLCDHHSTGEGRFAWFIEGFTEYLSWTLALRARVWKPSDYVRKYNVSLYQYQSSRVCDAPNCEIEKAFWGSKEIQRLPYLRGAMLARRWDSIIRNSSAFCLTDLMRRLVVKSQNSSSGLTIEMIVATGKELVDHDFAYDIQKYIVDGQKLPVSEQDLGPCVTLQLSPAIKYQFKLLKTYWEHQFDQCLAYLN